MGTASTSEEPAAAERLRTTAVLHLADVGGPAKTLLGQLRALAQRGRLEVVLPARGPAAELYSPFASTVVLPYTALTFPTGAVPIARAVTRFAHDVRVFRRYLRAARPDLLVVATAVLPAALVAARLERVPAVVSVGEILDPRPDNGLTRRLGSAFVARSTGALADAVVCCSQTVARQFSDDDGTIVATIYPGIEPPAPVRREAARRELAVPNDVLCLAVVGSLSAGRGQDLAIRALHELRHDVADARLLLAGDPHPRPVDRAYARSLEQLAEHLELRERVHFLGYVKNVEAVYAAADVVVNPARIREGFGRVAIEALLAQRPVVLTRTGAVDQLLRPDEDALIVPPESPAAIADAVLRLRRDPELARRLADTGERRVRERVSERRAVSDFVALIDEVLENRAPRAAAVAG